MVRNVKANVTNIIPWQAKNARKNKMQLTFFKCVGNGLEKCSFRGELTSVPIWLHQAVEKPKP